MKTDYKYDDIINMPHHVSITRPQMSIEARSAQFAPFAALTGYGDVIKETTRLTDSKREMDEGLKNILDKKLQHIRCILKENPRVTFTYFVPDLNKDGGEYKKTTGIIKKINDFDKCIVLEDGSQIPMNEIWDIDF